MAPILVHGSDWFRSITTDSPGNVIVTVVGDVVAPTSARSSSAPRWERRSTPSAAACVSGRSVKGGVLLRGGQPRRHRSPAGHAGQLRGGFAAIGSGIGSAGFVVYDDTACMVDTAYELSRFLAIESCGQCPPCKLGCGRDHHAPERIQTGVGTDDDIARIGGWLGGSPTAADASGHRGQRLVSSVLRAFPEEFAAHIEQRSCPQERPRPMPRSWSTSPTVTPPTTRRSGASAPIGPTNPSDDRSAAGSRTHAADQVPTRLDRFADQLLECTRPRSRPARAVSGRPDPPVWTVSRNNPSHRRKWAG